MSHESGSPRFRLHRRRRYGPVPAGRLRAGPTVLQPHACVSSHADLTLDNDPIHAWFKARDTVIDDYVFEWCRDVAFGPDAEHVLVGIKMGPRRMNGQSATAVAGL